MMLAYVEGLPIPSSSNFFTRLASEYLGGGNVKCCDFSGITLLIFVSKLTSGKVFSSSLLRSSSSDFFSEFSSFTLNSLYMFK